MMDPMSEQRNASDGLDQVRATITSPEFRDTEAMLDGDGVPVVPAWAFDTWREHVNVTMARIELSYAEEARRRRWTEYRWAQSGPNKIERQIAHAFRIKPHHIGVGAPPLAIDGHAYRQRQKNRVKRKQR